MRMQRWVVFICSIGDVFLGNSKFNWYEGDQLETIHGSSGDAITGLCTIGMS